MNSEKPEIISRSKDQETFIVQKAYIAGGENMVKSLVLCVNLIGGWPADTWHMASEDQLEVSEAKGNCLEILSAEMVQRIGKLG